MLIQFTAEAFGAIALVLNLIAYRRDSMDQYLMWSAGSMCMLSTHFLLLDAFAAAIGCGLAACRNLVALRHRGAFVVWFFVSLNILAMLLEFFVLHHGYLLFIAYSSGLIFTVGSIVIRDTELMRKWFLLAEALGAIYAILVGSIFGTLFNLVNITNILSKMWKQYRATSPN